MFQVKSKQNILSMKHIYWELFFVSNMYLYVLCDGHLARYCQNIQLMSFDVLRNNQMRLN